MKVKIIGIFVLMLLLISTNQANAWSAGKFVCDITRGKWVNDKCIYGDIITTLVASKDFKIYECRMSDIIEIDGLPNDDFTVYIGVWYEGVEEENPEEKEDGTFFMLHCTVLDAEKSFSIKKLVYKPSLTIYRPKGPMSRTTGLFEFTCDMSESWNWEHFEFQAILDLMEEYWHLFEKEGKENFVIYFGFGEISDITGVGIKTIDD